MSAVAWYGRLFFVALCELVGVRLTLTALAASATLVTRNQRDFEGIPGLRVQQVADSNQQPPCGQPTPAAPSTSAGADGLRPEMGLPMPASLEVRHVQQSYPNRHGGVAVLDNLSFEVERGELLCVMGPNGAGKSTLLRMLARLETPTAGTVTVHGTTRLLFQDNDLFPWLTVRQNIALGQSTSRLDRATYSRETAHLIERVGLAARLDAWPHELSGGNRQRASLVRCFLSGADVLLLDEPFAHLDPTSRLQLQTLLRELWRGGGEGPTIVLVTHDVDEAMALGRRVLVLNGPGPGRIFDLTDPSCRPRTFESGGVGDVLTNTLAELEASGRPPTAAAPQSRRMRLGYLLSPIVVLAVWELAASHGYLDTRFFPAPSTIAMALERTFTAGTMTADIEASAQRLFWGMLSGGTAGLILGILMGVHRWLRTLVDPLVALTYPLPKIAILPLLLVVFGIGETSKIVTLAIGAFFLVLLNTLHGVDEVMQRFGPTIRALNLRGLSFYDKIILRGALPAIVTGVRAAVGYCLVLMVAAEFTGARSGVGYSIWHAWELFDIETMYSGLVVLAVGGLLLFFVLDELQARIPWRRNLP